MEKKHKTRFGRVVSDKMDKTVVVAVETPKRHPLYKKVIRKVVKYKAHDKNNECSLGDMVRIVETRPLSAQKRWRVAEIIAKGEVVTVQPKEIKEVTEE
jgi:small subunit ribosomal protein S17